MVKEVIITFYNSANYWKEIFLNTKEAKITYYTPDNKRNKRKIHSEEFFTATGNQDVMQSHIGQIASMNIDVKDVPVLLNLYESDRRVDYEYEEFEYKNFENSSYRLSKTIETGNIGSKVVKTITKYDKYEYPYFREKALSPDTILAETNYFNTYNERGDLVQIIKVVNNLETIYTYHYPTEPNILKNVKEYIEFTDSGDLCNCRQKHVRECIDKDKEEISINELTDKSSTINIIRQYKTYSDPNNPLIHIRLPESKETEIIQHHYGKTVKTLLNIEYKSEIYLGDPSTKIMVTVGRVKSSAEE